MQQPTNDLVRRALARFQAGGGGTATIARLKGAGYAASGTGAPGKPVTLTNAAGVVAPPQTPNPIGLDVKRQILLGQALGRSAAGGPVSAATQARIDRGFRGQGAGIKFQGQALQNPMVRDKMMGFLRKNVTPFQQAPTGNPGALQGRYRQGF